MDDARYYTICNSHVLTGAKVIGYVGIVLSGLGLLVSLITLNLTNLLLVLMTLTVYVAIILAQRKRDPGLYVPYLIVNGIGMAFNAIYIAFLAVMLIAMPLWWQHELDRDERYHGKSLANSTRITTAIIFLLMVIVEGLTAWFQSIVYRAYRYMKEEHTNLIPPDVFVK